MPPSRGSCKLLHCGAAARRRTSPAGAGAGAEAAARGAYAGSQGCSTRLRPATRPPEGAAPRPLPGPPADCREGDRPRGCSGGCRRRGVKGPETKPRRRCRRCRRCRFGELSSQPIAREAGDVRQPPPGLQATLQAPTSPSNSNTTSWRSEPLPHALPGPCLPLVQELRGAPHPHPVSTHFRSPVPRKD